MDFIPKQVLELIAIVGISGVIALLFAMAFYIVVRAIAFRANAQTRQIDMNTQHEATVNKFAVELDLERKQMQQSINQLQAENFEIKLAQAEEKGRREEIKESMQRERDEWKSERLETNEKFRTMESRILELEKHRDQSVQRISELEKEIEALNKKLATANVEIDLLQAQKRELENLHMLEKNRADALSKLIERLQKLPSSDKTQDIPDMHDVDDTFITDPGTANVITPEIMPQTENNSISAAPVAAEETQK